MKQVGDLINRHATTFSQDYVAALVQLSKLEEMSKPKKVKHVKGHKGPKHRFVKAKLVGIQSINGVSLRDQINSYK